MARTQFFTLSLKISWLHTSLVWLILRLQYRYVQGDGCKSLRENEIFEAENQNINIATVSRVLAGGAIGGYLGAKTALQKLSDTF